MAEQKKFGDLTPIRRAHDEIGKMEAAQYDSDVARALADVRKIVGSAIAEAEHPELLDGLTTEEYALLHGITRSAVYKRIRMNKVNAERVPGVGYVIRAVA